MPRDVTFFLFYIYLYLFFLRLFDSTLLIDSIENQFAIKKVFSSESTTSLSHIHHLCWLFRAVTLFEGPITQFMKGQFGLLIRDFDGATNTKHPHIALEVLKSQLWTMSESRGQYIALDSRLDKQMPIYQTKNISKDQLIDANCVSVSEWWVSFFLLSFVFILAGALLLPSYASLAFSAQIIKIISKKNLPRNYARLLNYFGTKQFLFFYSLLRLFSTSLSFTDLFSISGMDFGLPCASFFISTTTATSTKTWTYYWKSTECQLPNKCYWVGAEGECKVKKKKEKGEEEKANRIVQSNVFVYAIEATYHKKY